MANSTHFGSLNIVKKMFGNKEILKEVCNGVVVYEKNTVKPYVTFSSASSFTIQTANSTKNWNGSLYYSTNGNTWNTWNGTSTLHSASDGTNHVIHIRGENNNVICNYNTNSAWTLTGSNIKVAGNIENLLDYLTVGYDMHPTMADSCFRNMFYQQTSLTDITELTMPAMTLTSACYRSMFYGTSITTIPEDFLPATIMAEECYYAMFTLCPNLTTVPKLPAMTLAHYCYCNMFNSCTSLNTLPALPATTLVSRCYYQMFYGCTSIKLSTSQTGQYQTAYRIPISGTGATASGALTGMFTNTGGSYTTPAYGSASINTTYYTPNTIIT